MVRCRAIACNAVRGHQQELAWHFQHMHPLSTRNTLSIYIRSRRTCENNGPFQAPSQPIRLVAFSREVLQAWRCRVHEVTVTVARALHAKAEVIKLSLHSLLVPTPEFWLAGSAVYTTAGAAFLAQPAAPSTSIAAGRRLQALQRMFPRNRRLNV